MKTSSVSSPIADGGIAADDRKDLAEFDTMVERKLSKEGVVLAGITYNSNELDALRTHMSDNNVNVRFNQDDLRRVLISPLNGTECIFVENTAGIDEAIGLDEWKDAVAEIEKTASRDAVNAELVRRAVSDLKQQGKS